LSLPPAGERFQPFNYVIKKSCHPAAFFVAFIRLPPIGNDLILTTPTKKKLPEVPFWQLLI
jgi:hypothetical protein